MSCQKCAVLETLRPPTAAPEHILNSNAPLLPSEAHQVQADIEAAESNIRVLEAQMAALEARRTEHTMYLRQHKPLVSSMRSVPTEIWAEIFSMAQKQFHLRRQTTMSRDAPCVQLSHVCRSWRRISIETPGLWTDIVFEIDRRLGTDGNTMLDTWLSRPKNSALFVDFDALLFEAIPFNQDEYTAKLSLIRTLLGLLLSHSHRWISFRMTITIEDVRAVKFKIKHAPILRELSLRIHSFLTHYGVDSSDDPLLEFGSVPALNTIETDHIYPVGCALQHLPWSSVTSFSLVCLNSQLGWPEWNSFFQKCSSLEHFSIGTRHIEPLTSSKRILLPNLQSLRVYFGTRTILESINTPVLKRLILDDLSEDEAVSSFVESFICRVPSIQEFSIKSGDLNISVPEIIQITFLQKWPIQVLEIDCYPSDSFHTFLELLSSREPQALLPKLRILNISLKLKERTRTSLHSGTTVYIRDAIIELYRQRIASLATNGTNLQNINVIIEIEAGYDRDWKRECIAFRHLRRMDLEGVDVLGEAFEVECPSDYDTDTETDGSGLTSILLRVYLAH